MKAVFLDSTTLGSDVDLAPIEQVTGGLTCFERTSPEQVLERIRGFDTVLVNKVVLGRDIDGHHPTDLSLFRSPLKKKQIWPNPLPQPCWKNPRPSKSVANR